MPLRLVLLRGIGYSRGGLGFSRSDLSDMSFLGVECAGGMDGSAGPSHPIREQRIRITQFL